MCGFDYIDHEALPIVHVLVEAEDWEEFCEMTTGEQQREAINYLCERGFKLADLTADVHEELEGSFDGSITWYVTTVKLDLEARGLIERIPRSSPQRLRLVNA